jgi:hypothetical protein
MPAARSAAGACASPPDSADEFSGAPTSVQPIPLVSPTGQGTNRLNTTRHV